MPVRPLPTRAHAATLSTRDALVAAIGATLLLAATSAAMAQPTTARMTQGAPTRDGGANTLSPSGSVNGRHVSTTGRAHGHTTSGHALSGKTPGPNDNT